MTRKQRNHNYNGTHRSGPVQGVYAYPMMESHYGSSGYGSYNPYGTIGSHHGGHYDPYRRPEYGNGHMRPSAGVEDKWRHTYPYVPTSYYYNNPNPPRQNPESIAFSEADTEAGDDSRENWGSKWEFIFSCIGLSVGIGNVWRFPKLAYDNGGASFLIPYFIILFVIGKPMYYLELALGQFSQRGPVKLWNMCPLGIGVGIGQCVVSIIVAIYYNVVLGYCLYYIFASFAAEVPWKKCSQNWGLYGDISADEFCYERGNNSTCDVKAGLPCETAAKQYFDKVVLGINNAYTEKKIVAYNESSTVEREFALAEFGNIGEIKWDITLCLLLSWTIVCLCLIKGIKSSGKVVYFSATFPYLLLITLMIYGLLQDGAMKGLKVLFVPEESFWDFSGKENSVSDVQVWRKAAEQMFFSLSISWGGLFMFGSYNKFKHRVHITATVISSLDFVTSIIASVLVFSILGAQSEETGIPVGELVAGGQGLAFISYPDALSQLPVPQLFTIMFFFMLFLLGIDSEFALLETVLTCVYDSFPTLKKYKPICTFTLCASCFLISLPCVAYSGQFVFEIMDSYGGGMSVLWIAIFEMICICWIYGANNVSQDLNFMLDIDTNKICAKISHWMMVILWYIIPLLLIVLLILGMITFKQPVYADKFYYPDWVHNIGYFLVVVAAAQFPVWAIFSMLYYLCHPKKQFMDVFRPTSAWGPGDRSQKKLWLEQKMRKHTHMHGYDNPTMAYPYYNYAGYGYGHGHYQHHM